MMTIGALTTCSERGDDSERSLKGYEAKQGPRICSGESHVVVISKIFLLLLRLLLS